MSETEPILAPYCEHVWKRRRGYWECERCGRNETDEYRELVAALGIREDGA